MKTKINKSQLFKMAWAEFKNPIRVMGREIKKSVSQCLRNAWFKLKMEALRFIKKSEPAQKPEPVVFDAAMERGITEYYRSQSGRYCGD